MSRIFRDIIVAVIGGVATFVILTVIAKRKIQPDNVGGKAIKALATSEGANMLRSTEGRAFTQTPEFRDFAKALTTAKAEKLLSFL